VLLELAASASGNAVNTEGFDVLVGGGGDAYKVVSHGDWSFAMAASAILAHNNVNMAASMGGAGIAELSYATNEDGDVTGNLRFFGSITGTATGSVELFDVGGSPSLGSSTGTPTGRSGGIAEGSINVNLTTGAVTGTVKASWSGELAADNPIYVDETTTPSMKPKIYFSTGGHVLVTFASTIDPATVCLPTTVEPDELLVEGSSGVDVGGAFEWYGEDIERDAEYGGTGSVKGTFLAPEADENDDPLTHKGCNKFLSVDFDYAYESDDASHSMTLDARVAMAAVAKCGVYYGIWNGPGVRTTVGVNTFTVACSVALQTMIYGSVKTAHQITHSAFYSVVSPSDPSSGNWKANISGTEEYSANISVSASNATVKAALLAMPFLSDGRVEVYGRGKDSAGATWGLSYDPWYITAVTRDGTPVAILGVTQPGFSGFILNSSGPETPTPTPIKFETAAKCPESGTATVYSIADAEGVTYSLGLTSTTRTIGDSQHFCHPECKGDGRGFFSSVPTSVGASLRGSAVGATPTLNEALIIPLTTRTPWVYDINHPFVTGNLAGDNGQFTIRFNTMLWRFELEVTDDEGTVCLTAHATCLYNATLLTIDSTRGLTWVIDTHTGFLADYTDLVFET
jgi:hypothetical protein